MNLIFFGTVSIWIIVTGQAANHNGRRAKAFTPRAHAGKASRRAIIIRCCGFKRCLPSNKRTKAKSTNTTVVEESRASSLLGNTFAPSTGNWNHQSQITDAPVADVTTEAIGAPQAQSSAYPSSDIATILSKTESSSPGIDSSTPPQSTTGNTGQNQSTNQVPVADVSTTVPSAAQSSAKPSVDIVGSSTVLPPSVASTSGATTTKPSTSTTSAAVLTTSTLTTTAQPMNPTTAGTTTSTTTKTTTSTPTTSTSTTTKTTTTTTTATPTTVTRNEAALRCKAMNLTLLTVTSLQELDCLASVKIGTFWTSGSNEDPKCDLEKKYTWCSIAGFNIPLSLTASSSKFWLPNVAAPTSSERCLAVVTSTTDLKGLVHRKCDDTLPYICQLAAYKVDCPSNTCTKNASLFDANGNLQNKTSYGYWIDLGSFTYLLGNKLMNWESSFFQCCALGMQPLKIETAEEQASLTNMTVIFKDKWPANFNYWTSGTWKGAPVGMWSWCDSAGPAILGQGLTWENGQPDNNGGAESCIHFRFVLNSTGTILTDRNCSSKYIFACKTPRVTTPKPAPSTLRPCQHDPKLFNSDNKLIDYTSYGDWFGACGRSILFYNKTPTDWAGAWDTCCSMRLTLSSLETSGKINCFSRTITTFASSATIGDFWLSGTSVGSNFQWVSLGRDFVNSEVKWKDGHPQQGLNCVYLEARNGSALLATANCNEKKPFLCDVLRKGQSQVALQNECVEIWQITYDQLALLASNQLFNGSNFLYLKTDQLPTDLKCFLRCIGAQFGLFSSGGINFIEMMRQVELASMEEPEKLEQGFTAQDECSGIQTGDECENAAQTYQCGVNKAPDLVASMVSNNFGSGPVIDPPVPCTVKRSCWIRDNNECPYEPVQADLFYNQTYRYGKKVIFQDKTYFVAYYDNETSSNEPTTANGMCCGLGMRLYEPQTLQDLLNIQSIVADVYGNNSYVLLLGDTEFINSTHEVWCQSRTVIPDNMYDPADRYPCTGTIVSAFRNKSTLTMYYDPSIRDIWDYQKDQDRIKYEVKSKQWFFQGYICEKV